MIRKYLLLALLCLVGAGLLVDLRMTAMDNLFRDWHQILTNRAPPENPFVLLDISELQTAGFDQNKFEPEVIQKVVRSLLSQDSKSVGLTFSASEVTKPPDLISALLSDSDAKKIWFLSNASLFKEQSFSKFRDLIPEENQLFLTLTYDSAFDSVSRRILTFYGLDKKTPSSDFNEVNWLTGKDVSPYEIVGDFEYLDSRQVFMKIWPREKWKIRKIKSLDELSQLTSVVKNKIVLVGTSGRYSLNSTPGIQARMRFFGDPDIDSEYLPAHELIANYMTSIYHLDYVKVPSDLFGMLWIFAGLLVILGTLLFAPVSWAFGMGTLSILAFLLFGWAVFWGTSYEMDSVRVALVGVVGQYLIIPFRYHQLITKRNKERYESEAQLLEEKMKARTLILAAASDANMRFSAKVSHDIRSPLMALRIVSKYLVGVNEEVRQLFEDATNRIDHIAEDTLSKFRMGSGPMETEKQRSSMKEVVDSLRSSFQQVHENLKVENKIDDKVVVDVPFYSLQRCLANLIQNSVEACLSANKAPVVEISARLKDSYYFVQIRDNGPGVPDQVRKELFSARATHGKAQGTGLGLFQIREELENFGSSISYEDVQAGGACFILRIPIGLESLQVITGGQVVLIGPEDFTRPLRVAFEAKGILVKVYSNFVSCRKELVGQGAQGVLISELLLELSQGNAFDLIDELPAGTFRKKIVCTSLIGNKEIFDLAVKREALLVSRSQLQTINFIRE